MLVTKLSKASSMGNGMVWYAVLSFCKDLGIARREVCREFATVEEVVFSLRTSQFTQFSLKGGELKSCCSCGDIVFRKLILVRVRTGKKCCASARQKRHAQINSPLRSRRAFLVSQSRASVRVIELLPCFV